MLRKEDISVLIVDDLQFSCEVIKSSLKKAGYKDIRTANSANEAMLKINKKRPDVVLADFWMPEMNGLEMTDLIRRWDENNNRYTGIILLTAEDTTSSIVVAFDRGVDDFISKSTNQYELAARVYGTGRSARMQNELRQNNRDLITHYQRFQNLVLTDLDTGLANRKQLEVSMNAMMDHCEARGGGVALCLIRITAEGEKNQPGVLRRGTLRTISNSLQLVLRPMDQIVRYDECTFAVALMYSDQEDFNPSMFERSTASILHHTHQFSDRGERLRISTSIWYTTEFNDIPGINQILTNAEINLKPTEPAEQTKQPA